MESPLTPFLFGEFPFGKPGPSNCWLVEPNPVALQQLMCPPGPHPIVEPQIEKVFQPSQTPRLMGPGPYHHSPENKVPK